MKKETRGRKKIDNPASMRIEIRVTEELKERCERAAKNGNISLSKWFRLAALNKL